MVMTRWILQNHPADFCFRGVHSSHCRLRIKSFTVSAEDFIERIVFRLHFLLFTMTLCRHNYWHDHAGCKENRFPVCLFLRVVKLEGEMLTIIMLLI